MLLYNSAIGLQAKTIYSPAWGLFNTMKRADDKELGSLADEIASLQTHYLLQNDGRATRLLIVGLVNQALRLRAGAESGFNAKSRILLAMRDCGVEWLDGLDKANTSRKSGHTALETLGITLAMDITAAKVVD